MSESTFLSVKFRLVRSKNMSGKIVTQGDRILRTNTARSSFNVDGSGIRIGIISSSFDARYLLASDISNGELPGANNPEGKLQSIQVLDLLQKYHAIAFSEAKYSS